MNISEAEGIKMDYEAGFMEIPYYLWDSAPQDLKDKWLTQFKIQLTLFR